MPRVEYEKLSDNRLGEPSAVIRQRVETAQEQQRLRFAHVEVRGNSSLQCNADTPAIARRCKCGPSEVRQFCQVDGAGSDKIETTHPSASLGTGLAEAIQYRPRRQV